VAYEYRYDRKLNCLLIRLFDTVVPQDIADLMRKAHSDGRFDPSAARLYDARDVFGAMSEGEIREAAMVVGNYDEFGPPRATAYVATGDLNFALGRMMQSLRDAQGYKTVQVFRDMPEAVRWLGLSKCPDDPFREGVWQPDNAKMPSA
jgi:hypothetical protein